MSEANRTYTDREIVLEFFPATREDLIPAPFPYRLEALSEGQVLLEHQHKEQSVTLKPVSSTGKISTLLCCDLCGHQAARKYIQMYRGEVVGSHGKRLRYLSLCRHHEACGTRQISTKSISSIENFFM